MSCAWAALFVFALGLSLPTWAASPTAAASLTNAPVLPPVAPDIGASIVRTLGALGIVVALLLGGAWLFRNWQRLAVRKGGPPQLQVIEVRPLGQRHALYVVGYRDQRMLLAASPGGVSLLSHLPSAEAAPAPAALPAPGGPSTSDEFTVLLQQALQNRS